MQLGVAGLGFLLLLSLAVSGRAHAQVEADGWIVLFENGVFTPHTTGYDSLGMQPAIQPYDSSEERLAHTTYAMRWGNRALALAVALADAPPEQRAWLRRAMELVIWQTLRSPEERAKLPESLARWESMPPCMGPDEVRDLLTIDRVFYRMEREEERRRGGGTK